MIQDLHRKQKTEKIDVYLETPGGSGESAEEIARFLHKKYTEVNYVIAGEAKSAGTLLVLSGDNIYMTDTGSLGPIDAQIKIGRTVVSAYDYREWINEKRKEAEENRRLNPLDAIIVSQISPGEIKKVINQLEFAKDLVKEWLVKYKFKNWTITETRGLKVSNEMKEQRANTVAEALTNQSKLRTHGRSLKIEDLSEWLKIERIDDTHEISEIIYRIKAVIRHIFDQSSAYKLFSTEENKIMRTFSKTTSPPNRESQTSSTKNIPAKDKISLNIKCPKCNKNHNIIAYFGKKDDKEQIKNPNVTQKETIICDNCKYELDLKPIKNDLELKFKTKIHL